MEVGFNFDIRGDILPTPKMYHYRFVFAYCIGNGNFGVVYVTIFFLIHFICALLSCNYSVERELGSEIKPIPVEIDQGLYCK